MPSLPLTSVFRALPDPRRVKHRNGLATLAFDRGLLRLPAALMIGNRAQRGGQIVFLDDLIAPRREFDMRGRSGPAIRTDERLLAGIPLRLAATSGAGEFIAGRYFRHGVVRG